MSWSVNTARGVSALLVETLNQPRATKSENIRREKIFCFCLKKTSLSCGTGKLSMTFYGNGGLNSQQGLEIAKPGQHKAVTCSVIILHENIHVARGY